jgi:thiamine-phosphate pyrophosphorylase
MKAMDLEYSIKRGVYLISPPQILDLIGFAKELKTILKKTQVSMFQLRLKEVKEADIMDAINTLKPICIKYKTEFILNDNSNLASTYALDGVHLGELDGNLGQIRRSFKGIMGVSCYNNLDRAFEMAKLNVDYVSFGAFYKSTTKLDTKECDISIIKAFKAKSKIPICVIGGINPDNAKPLIKSGADLVAISSAVWSLPKTHDKILAISSIYSYFCSNL